MFLSYLMLPHCNNIINRFQDGTCFRIFLSLKSPHKYQSSEETKLSFCMLLFLLKFSSRGMISPFPNKLIRLQNFDQITKVSQFKVKFVSIKFGRYAHIFSYVNIRRKRSAFPLAPLVNLFHIWPGSGNYGVTEANILRNIITNPQYFFQRFCRPNRNH